MPFIMMQQVQPAFIMAVQQSQQAWIMSQQAASPLVQVMQTPLSVISHLHMAMVMLQQQAIMPFIMQQQEHIPPAIMVQRFWIIAAEAASSLTQFIFIPPLHFSIVMVQRGTIIMFDPAGMVDEVPMAPVLVPLMPIMLARSIIIALVIVLSPCCALSSNPSGPTGPTGSSLSESRNDLQRISLKTCDLLHDLVAQVSNQAQEGDDQANHRSEPDREE
jgi:hypothetical protein